ncbi:hypothetical protein KQX54_016821 [Cotesia glomerata]|uniref:Uncharacterized protein n=1 Tax=Cotesia glomerata TaxID=32391 RepID=A0AAV7ICH4_COTGL|nr:hypothetical protein KQX54_016821 [Cotesia glomerata]
MLNAGAEESDSDEVWPRGLPQHCYVLAAPHGHPGGRHTPSSRIVGTYFPRATRRVKDVFRRWLRPSRLWGKTTSRQSFEDQKQDRDAKLYISVCLYCTWELNKSWLLLMMLKRVWIDKKMLILNWNLILIRNGRWAQLAPPSRFSRGKDARETPFGGGYWDTLHSENILPGMALCARHHTWRSGIGP